MMKKEDVLAMAQAESRDEREERVKDQSMRWTYIVMVLTAAVFAFIRAEKGESMMDLSVTVCASVAAGQFYRFGKTKERYCLGLALVALCVGVLALVRFCLGY